MTSNNHNRLRLKRVGIDTHQEAVIYMRADCHICRAEGFSAHARVRVDKGPAWIIATLNTISGDLLAPGEASLSESAWSRLGAADGDEVSVSHPRPLDSLGLVRAKIYGRKLKEKEYFHIIEDVLSGRFSDIHLSSFITACTARGLGLDEMVGLTRAMVDVGDRLDWGATPIVDKHCVGGLPGNRTTPIIVAIMASLGFTMPKTSSRAITSPAGTADAMETLAPVELGLPAIRRVVEQEGGCIVWGGAVNLSPADDVLIRVERALDIDSEGQLVASVLSKKAAAGATHLILDLPVGPTAKVRTEADAAQLAQSLLNTAATLGIKTHAVRTDGTQPVGRGIGPALEARDVLAVLQNQTNAPLDLKMRAAALAGALLELVGRAAKGDGAEAAVAAIDDGAAWRKFQAICEAQGGMRTPPVARHSHPVEAEKSGRVIAIDNRKLAQAAKLAGAPEAKAAGVTLEVKIGAQVGAGQPVFTLHADTKGELKYALDYVAHHSPIIDFGEEK